MRWILIWLLKIDATMVLVGRTVENFTVEIIWDVSVLLVL
jgi:hypothetical protein